MMKKENIIDVKEGYDNSLLFKSLTSSKVDGEDPKFVRADILVSDCAFYSDCYRVISLKKTHVLSLRNTTIRVESVVNPNVKVSIYNFATQEMANNSWRKLTGLNVSLNKNKFSELDTRSQIIETIPEDCRIAAKRYKSDVNPKLRLNLLVNESAKMGGTVRFIPIDGPVPTHLSIVAASQVMRCIMKDGMLSLVTHIFSLSGSSIAVDPIGRVDEDFLVSFSTRYHAEEYWKSNICSTISSANDETIVNADRNTYPELGSDLLIRLIGNKILRTQMICNKLYATTKDMSLVVDLSTMTPELEVELPSGEYTPILEVRKLSGVHMIDYFDKNELVWKRRPEFVVYNGVKYDKSGFLEAISLLSPKSDGGEE